MFSVRFWVFCAGLLVVMAGQVLAQPWQPHVKQSYWWRNTSTLDMDFANNRYMVSLTTPVTYTSLTQFITAVSGTFTRAGANETATGDPFYLGANQSFVSRATSTTQLTATGSPFYADASQAFYSRASTGTYFDSSGVMQTAASNVARADYDPLTLAYKGILIEPARTNYISNSTMQWSALWPVGWAAAGYGVTPTVVASGTVSGMNYIDVQFLGVGDTVSRGIPQRFTNVQFGSYVNTAANADWATSVYVGYVSGSYPTGTYKGARLYTGLFNSSKAYLGELNQQSLLDYTGSMKRVGIAGTTTSSTAYLFPYFQLTYDQGESVNLTLRFAAPQAEMGTSSTSFIPTTSAPVARAADVYTQQTASYFDSAGLLKFATAGAARADYHPSTLAYRGILAEPARTNLQYYSNDFSMWTTGSGVSVTQNMTGPDGNVNAWTFTQTGVNGTDSRRQFNLGVVSDTSPYVFSVFVKKAASAPSTYPAIVLGSVYYGAMSTVEINPYTGAINKVSSGGTAGVIDSGSYWRVWAAINNDNQTTIFAQIYPSWSATWGGVQASVMGGSAVFYGAQLEKASVPSSYIPTSNNQASRAADVYTSGYSGTYFDSTGTLRNAPANTPRLDYDPSTSEPKGVLIEEARTNLLLQSQLNATYWANGPNVAVSYSNALSPMGDMTAATVAVSGSGILHRWLNSNANGNKATISVGTTYTYSVYVKPNTSVVSMSLTGGKSDSTEGATANYHLVGNGSVMGYYANGAGTYVGSGIQSVGSGWYRIWVASQTSSTTAGHVGLSIPNSSDAVPGTSWDVWGAQIEQGAFPTSYIPTSGTAVTRAADVFTLPTSTGWYNGNAGTLAVEAITPASYYNGLGGVSRWLGFASIDDGTVSNTVHLFFSDSSNSQQVMASEAFASGVSYYSSYYSTSQGMPSQYPNGYPTDTYPSSSLTKGAVTYSAGSTRSAYNGLSFAAGGGFTLPTATMLRVGARRGGSGILNSSVRRVWYMPTRQPDESLPDYTR